MKIAILGGRFDPPHLGHFWVIQQVLEFRKDIEKIILIPASKHQWKPTVASGQDRIHMLQAYKTKNIYVSDVELNRKGVSYSIDTVRQLKKKTKDTIYWIIGSDIVSEFHRWEKAEDLAQEATMLVFPRDPYNIPDALPKGFEVLREKSLVTSNLSSTIIRERIKRGLSIENFVLPSVSTYIAKNKLYRDNILRTM